MNIARGAGHGSCSGERPRLHPIHLPTVEFGWQSAGQRGKMARWQAARWHLPLAPAGQCWHRSHIAVIIITRSLPCHQTRSHSRYLNTLTYCLLLLEWSRETMDVLEILLRRPQEQKPMDKATETRYTIQLLHDKFPTIAKMMQNIECGCWCAASGRGWASFVHWIIFHVSCWWRCHHGIISTQILHVSGPRMCTVYRGSPWKGWSLEYNIIYMLHFLSSEKIYKNILFGKK